MRLKTGISGIILAGGKNTRMGTEKALLEINGRRIIEIVSDTLRPLTDEILIVSNNTSLYQAYGDRVVTDLIPGRGPLGGIHAGLIHAHYQTALVTACDTPFVSAPLIRLLIESSLRYDIVVPRYRGYLEPLFAMYNKKCLCAIETYLDQGHNKITGFYPKLRVRHLEEEEITAVEPAPDKVFMNVNTPADLEKAQLLLSLEAK